MVPLVSSLHRWYGCWGDWWTAHCCLEKWPHVFCQQVAFGGNTWLVTVMAGVAVVFPGSRGITCFLSWNYIVIVMYVFLILLWCFEILQYSSCLSSISYSVFLSTGCFLWLISDFKDIIWVSGFKAPVLHLNQESVLTRPLSKTHFRLTTLGSPGADPRNWQCRAPLAAWDLHVGQRSLLSQTLFTLGMLQCSGGWHREWCTPTDLLTPAVLSRRRPCF